jgi:hypothetical protein
LLSKWFARNWGTAVGIIMAGGSVGAMVIQPLVGIAASRAVKMIFRHKAGYPVEFGLTINQRTFAIKGYDKFLRSVAC